VNKSIRLFVCVSLLTIAAIGQQAPTQEIEKTLHDYFQAMSEFSRTGDTEAIMRNYTTGYIEIVDGQRHSATDVRREWQNIREKMNLGDKNKRTVAITSIEKVQILDSMAQAVVTFEEKFGSGGSVKTKYSGTCSYFLVKQPEGGRWLIDHEHCSRVKSK
jgi:ketosteroid isomerase-like protein